MPIVRHLPLLSVLAAIAVAPAHATPVTVDDVFTPTSTVFSVGAPGVLGNDSTSSGGLRVTSINATGLQGSIVAFADGHFTFTPQAGLATNTSFAYAATDNAGGSSTATVVFDMVSTLPRAVLDSYAPNATTFQVTAPSGLLANDTGGIGALRVTSINATGLQGSIVAFADGHFSFTPQAGLATNTGFSYNIADELGRTSTATVNFDMVSTLPRAIVDSYTPNATTFQVASPSGLLANDTGGIGALRVTSINATGLQGSIVAFADGHFSFTPQAGLATNTGFSYNIADELGRTSTATVNFDMVSSLPNVIDDLYDVLAGDVLNIAAPFGLLANDTGGIGALRVTSINATGLQGSIVAFADGHFSFQPRAGFTGHTFFRYNVVDQLGRASSALASIFVQDGNVGSVPEPSSLALVAAAVFGLQLSRRRFGARNTAAR